MIPKQALIRCRDCVCIISDAISVQQVHQVRGCFRYNNVQWNIYGYNNQYLGSFGGQGCCYGTLDLTYTPVLDSTTKKPSPVVPKDQYTVEPLLSSSQGQISTHSYQDITMLPRSTKNISPPESILTKGPTTPTTAREMRGITSSIYTDEVFLAVFISFCFLLLVTLILACIIGCKKLRQSFRYPRKTSRKYVFRENMNDTSVTDLSNVTSSCMSYSVNNEDINEYCSIENVPLREGNYFVLEKDFNSNLKMQHEDEIASEIETRRNPETKLDNNLLTNSSLQRITEPNITPLDNDDDDVSNGDTNIPENQKKTYIDKGVYNILRERPQDVDDGDYNTISENKTDYDDLWSETDNSIANSEYSSFMSINML